MVWNILTVHRSCFIPFAIHQYILHIHCSGFMLFAIYQYRGPSARLFWLGFIVKGKTDVYSQFWCQYKYYTMFLFMYKCKASKMKYKLKRNRGFRPKCLKDFKWLLYDEAEEVMFCKTCLTQFCNMSPCKDLK